MKDENDFKIIALDFDGTVHKYMSHWQGFDVISDGPVEGAKEFIDALRDDGYKVVIFSSRCKEEKGIIAMKEWFEKHDIVVEEIVKEKPPALVTLDDRAITFNGSYDGMLEKVKNFVPWNRK